MKIYALAAIIAGCHLAALVPSPAASQDRIHPSYFGSGGGSSGSSLPRSGGGGSSLPVVGLQTPDSPATSGGGFVVRDYISGSIERLKSPVERSALQAISAELKKKSYEELIDLRLSNNDVCQEIACRGAPSDTVLRYVQAYAEARVNENTFRSAAAAENSSWVAGISLVVAILSLSLSVASFWRSRRTQKTMAAE